jgi:glutamate dehydrogenase (NADP+)
LNTNIPTDLEGVHIFKHAKLLYAPGKASNAGGVAVSGLEMSQNSERRSWKEEELQQMLKDIMAGIHNSCIQYGNQGGGYIDHVKGAGPFLCAVWAALPRFRRKPAVQQTTPFQTFAL